jgi:3-hexulose-6-phosphate synthase/6-phospho-3-hexuloisomerase
MPGKVKTPLFIPSVKKYTPMKPIIQLALDFVDYDRAVKVAREAAGSVDWIEAGTPLIKSEGLDVVRKLRAEFPDKTIVADMKVMDAGRIEVEAAAKAGAVVVDVCGQAADATIRECVEAGRNYGAKIVVDLIGVRDVVSRAREVVGFGVDYISVHTAIDEQMEVKTPFSVVKEVVDGVDVPVAVAGGLNSESVVDAVEARASILIVGGAITKAEDAGKAAAAIRRAADSRKRVKSGLFKRSTDVRQILEKVSTANLSDALHRQVGLTGVKPVTEGIKLVGRAVTVRTYPGDWAKPVEAIDVAGVGDVIVVDAGGVGPAVWGELASESALQRRIEGVVVYGGVRDVAEIRGLGFKVFASLVSPAAGEPRGFGEINVPVDVAGTVVMPGDWIVGDDDGVMVLPAGKAVEYANRAQDVLERENRIRREIRGGGTLSRVIHLLKWEKKV